MNASLRIIGMPWLKKEDYSAFRTLVPSSYWDTSFEAWEARAIRLAEQVESDGALLVRIPIQCAVFLDWCFQQDRKIDAVSFGLMAHMTVKREVQQLYSRGPDGLEWGILKWARV